MLARLQRLILFGAAAIAFVWWAVCYALGRPVVGLFPGLLLLTCYPLFIAVELLLAAHVSKPAQQPAVSEMLRAWWGEVLLGPVIFCWQQPFRTWSEPDNLSSARAGRRGVVLVHGLMCNRAFWNSWMRRLREDGTAYVAVDLEPLFDSIDHYPAIIDEAVVSITAATGLAPVLVGHSMGGLAIRQWLLRPADDAPRQTRVHHVITLGTPHRGTWLARFASTTNGREMAVGSKWLERLEMLPGATSAAPLFTCYYGNCDNVVFPPFRATLPGADNRLLGATAHMKLAFRPEVFDELRRCLDEPGPRSSTLLPSASETAG